MSSIVRVVDERELMGKHFRIYGDFENPLFIAKDVAEWIEHKNPTEMIRNVDEDEKLLSTILSAGQNRVVTMLTEDGLYEVLMQSRKPIAKQFKKKVKEILKEIRKTGQYAPTKPEPKKKSILYKTYQGRPVLIMRDFVDMLEVAHVSINQMCIRHNVPRILLNGEEVRAFKKENPGQFHPSLSNIAVFPEEATRQLMRLYGVPFGDMSIYFEVSSTPPLVPVAVPVDSPVPSLRLKIETAEELLRTAKELLDTCV